MLIRQRQKNNNKCLFVTHHPVRGIFQTLNVFCNNVVVVKLMATSSSSSRRFHTTRTTTTTCCCCCVDERPKQKRPKKETNRNRVRSDDWFRFFSLSTIFFSSSSSFFLVSLCLFRAREREKSSVLRQQRETNTSSFFPRNVFYFYEHTPVIKRDTKERHVYIHTRTHTFVGTRDTRRRSRCSRGNHLFSLLFSVVLLLSVSFAARFGGFVQRRGKNENSLTSHRRALLQRARCSNPWCFLISRRQRVKIRQCAVPQCARRVKPFSCSLEYCCASWCRNLPWEMLIRAPPPLCRDCVIAYRPGCCGWCKQVPSQYYGGVVGCYNCLAYALEVRFVPIIKPIYGRCEYW